MGTKPRPDRGLNPRSGLSIRITRRFHPRRLLVDFEPDQAVKLMKNLRRGGRLFLCNLFEHLRDSAGVNAGGPHTAVIQRPRALLGILAYFHDAKIKSDCDLAVGLLSQTTLIVVGEDFAGNFRGRTNH